MRQRAVEHVVELGLASTRHRHGEEVGSAQLERARHRFLVQSPFEGLEVGAHLGQQRVGRAEQLGGVLPAVLGRLESGEPFETPGEILLVPGRATVNDALVQPVAGLLEAA